MDLSCQGSKGQGLGWAGRGPSATPAPHLWEGEETAMPLLRDSSIFKTQMLSTTFTWDLFFSSSNMLLKNNKTGTETLSIQFDHSLVFLELAV